MRYIFILLLALSLIGCSQPIIADTIPIAPETVVVTETVIVTETITVEDTAKIIELQNEVDSYKALISNLNELLKNVYYVYGEGNGSYVYSTGFSIVYNDKFYLITAGHTVDGEWGIHKNLGFKVNDKLIYPKLINYSNDIDIGNDYAIFYSDKIDSGFIIDTENDNPAFILGDKKLNTVKSYYNTNDIGESGSPIIDNEGEVVGIAITDIYTCYTKINKVLNSIE